MRLFVSACLLAIALLMRSGLAQPTSQLTGTTPLRWPIWPN